MYHRRLRSFLDHSQLNSPGNSSPNKEPYEREIHFAWNQYRSRMKLLIDSYVKTGPVTVIIRIDRRDSHIRTLERRRI